MSQDESRNKGTADFIAFPKTVDEVRQILIQAGTNGTAVTVQGSLTGITAGAVPDGGYILELRTLEGKVISGKLPLYRMPAVKNAAGYFTGADIDMLDLFIGSEGTLGVVTELEIRLLKAPVALLGVMSFFSDENNAIEYVSSIRTKISISRESTLPAKLVAIEYFGKEALDLLREQKNTNPAFGKIPDIPIKYQTGIYTEYHGEVKETFDPNYILNRGNLFIDICPKRCYASYGHTPITIKEIFKMKICITSSGNSVESNLDTRFGRCSYFVIMDLQTGKDKIIENSAASAGGGAGVASGQLMIENNVKVLITGNVGPNAMSVLKTAGIEIYRGENVSVKQNIEKFMAGSLKKIIETVPSHYGMKKGE